MVDLESVTNTITKNLFFREANQELFIAIYGISSKWMYQCICDISKLD